MMKKHKTILAFLKRLKSSIHFDLFEFVDYWDADPMAIGLKKGYKVVYISTCNYVKSKPIKYDYDFEVEKPYDVSDDELPYYLMQEGRGVSEAELINEIRAYWEIE